jgi:predicted amidohydrolase YtcJ
MSFIRRRAITTAVALCVTAVPVPAIANAQRVAAPDLVLTGGRIFTADSLHPWAEAIAVRGARIVAVGRDAGIAALASPATRRVALGGRVVVPGFNDAHTHIGADGDGVRFATSDSPTPDTPIGVIVDSLAAIVKRAPSGTWIRTEVGENVLGDPAARRTALDRVAPRHPVILHGWTGHGAVLNSAAMVVAKLDTVKDPEGGWIERDSRGRATGRIDEYVLFNMGRRRSIARGAPAAIAALRSYDAQAATFGITSVQNMVTGLTPSILAAATRANALRLRHRVIPFEMSQVGSRETAWRGVRGGNALTTVSGAKTILDGTPIERLALMRAPYADRAGWYGRANWPLDTIVVLLREAIASGQQPIFHSVGDSTIALVFTAMRRVAPDSTWRRVRLRLEHADNLMPDQFADAKRLGIVVVQNPTHLAVPVLAARWGAERVARSQMLRGILAAGIPLAIGSDGPANPYLNIMFAAMNPANTSQALTREQAVVAYTRMSAYAEHAERDKGTLAVGKLADLAVLSQDIFTIPLQALPGTTSVLTLVGGRVTHDALGQKP